MDSRVTPLPHPSEPASPPPRSSQKWTGVLLVAAGVAFGFLLGQGTTDTGSPVDTEAAEAITSTTAPADPVAASEPPAEEVVKFPGTILASVEFGRGLVTWPGDGNPIKTRLASDVSAAAYDAAQGRIAVTLPEYGTDRLALHVGKVGNLRFVASGVTGFAWHPTDPNAIAWVEESEDAFALMKADISDGRIGATRVALLPDLAEPVAWGAWGYALQGDKGLETIGPDGAAIASADVQFVAAGSDGRLVVARPAGIPLSSDWAITEPGLTDQQALGRFDDWEEHPTAAAILPRSGRIVLVSNRFGDRGGLARIEVLSDDGTSEAMIRSGMIADSIAWSPGEDRLAVGGYYYRSNQVRSVVLLTDVDGMSEPVEVPFDHQVRPLGIRTEGAPW
jgi:sugar lactone lactonase YvrE